MGRDKAFLPFRNGTLAGSVAAMVAEAAGSATLVGDPNTYQRLGFPVLPDALPGLGPLGGIHSALSATGADWNLVVACDMPALNTRFMQELLAGAENSGADCLLPRGPGGRPEPLCAVYHRRAAEPIGRALARGIRKVTEGLAELRVAYQDVAQVSHFENLNTPEDWAAHARER